MIASCLIIISTLMYNPNFCPKQCQVTFCLQDKQFIELFDVTCPDGKLVLKIKDTDINFGELDEKCSKA